MRANRLVDLRDLALATAADVRIRLEREDEQAVECMHLNRNSLRQWPPVLNDFSGLTELNLAKNALTDIPATLDLPNLRFLDVSRNELHSLENVGRLCNLEYLNAKGNFVQRIPRCIARLSKLQKLNLSFNPIGHVRYEIVPDALPHLRWLSLEATRVPLGAAECYRNRKQVAAVLEKLSRFFKRMYWRQDALLVIFMAQRLRKSSGFALIGPDCCRIIARML